MKLNFYPKKAIFLGLLCGFTLLNGCKTDLEPVPEEAKQTGVSNATLGRHPGLLNTQESLDYIKTNMTTNSSRLNVFSYSVRNFARDTAVSDFVTRTTSFNVLLEGGKINVDERKMKTDALLAYANALAWVGTGEVIYSNKAKQILSAYGNRFIDFTKGTGDTEAIKGLEGSWVAPTFVEAAEIIRHYKRDGVTPGAGWATADKDKFGLFIKKLRGHILNHIILEDDIYLHSAVQTDAGRLDPTDNNNLTRWAGLRRNNSNIGVSAAQASIAIGVYLSKDEPTLGNDTYNKGRSFLYDKLTSINKADHPEDYRLEIRGKDGGYLQGFHQLINTGIAYDNGNSAVKGFVYDNGHKDCKHFQYTLNGVTYAAEIARNNGDNIFYPFGGNTLLEGYNYHYNTQFASGAKDRQDARTCNDDGLPVADDISGVYPGVEVAYRYYSNTSGNVTSIQALRNRASPSSTKPLPIAKDLIFLGFTTFTHYGVPL